ncbi:MAG: acyltransferase [Prevotellaceae bacterium]|nr:acyltransferase [Prevotellaceae bacterium]MDY3365260.1 acyltransferase [Prevotella sp.]
MKQTGIYLASKPRYEVLDGLRGVAAMMVILFHCFEGYYSVLGRQEFYYGSLAVDFFFMLSGFVMGYAYDDRWEKMSVRGFFKRRLVRLHPMVIAGTLIGAAWFFFGAGEKFHVIAEVEAWKFFLCLVMGLLMIPCSVGLDIRGWAELNSFNGPNWSLTFEYIGNILYAFILRHLSTAALAVLCVVSLFFTFDLTLGWDVFHLLPNGPQYSISGGWTLTPDHVYIGMTRLMFPLLCGLVMSRLLGKRITRDNPSGSPLGMRGGFWVASLVLVVLLSMPIVGGKSGIADGIYQLSVIVLAFPLVLLIGAGSQTSDAKSTAWCNFLGQISYPLYITHYPIMYMQMAWVERNAHAPIWMHVCLNIGVIAMSVFTAWALLKLYDEPVREWLKEKFLKGNSTQS